jgi:hypothetical protein
MQRHKCNKHIYLFKNNISRDYSFMKNWALQTYPLKMNLVPEIQMGQKRNLEILPLTLLLSLK